MSATALGRVSIIVDLEGDAEKDLAHLSNAFGHLGDRLGSGVRGGAQQGTSALGGFFSRASSGLQSLIQQAENPLGGLVGGLLGGLGLHALIDVNNEFDNTRRALAGTLETVGLVTGGWENALDAANTQMTRIQAAAAALPGEADDYIHAFQGAVPQLQAASQYMRAFVDEQGHAYTGMSGMGDAMSEMTDFTNQFMAVAIGKGVDAGSAAQMITRALASGKGSIDQQSVAWSRLGPYIQTASRNTEHMVNSASDFNKLTLEQRTQLLQNTITGEGLRNVITDASTSWDAQMGTLTTISKTMLRMATSPLFHTVSDWLGRINALIMNSDGSFTDLGKTINTMVEILTYAGVAWAAFEIIMAPTTWTVMAVAAAVYGLAKAWEYVKTHWDELKQDPFIGTLIRWGEAAKAIGTGIYEIFSTLSGETGSLSEETYNKLESMGLVDTVTDLAAALYRAWQFAKGMWEGVTAAAGAIWSAVKPVVVAFMQMAGMDTGFFDAIDNIDPAAYAEAGRQVGQFVVDWMTAITKPFQWAFQFGEWIAQTQMKFDALIATAVLFGNEVYHGFVGSQPVQKFLGAVQTLKGFMTGMIDGFVAKWREFMALIDEAWNKVAGMANNPVVRGILGAAEDAGSFVAHAFDPTTTLNPRPGAAGAGAPVVVPNRPPATQVPSFLESMASMVNNAVGHAGANYRALSTGGRANVPQIVLPPQPPVQINVDGRVLAEAVGRANSNEEARLGVQ